MNTRVKTHKTENPFRLSHLHISYSRDQSKSESRDRRTEHSGDVTPSSPRALQVDLIGNFSEENYLM